MGSKTGISEAETRKKLIDGKLIAAGFKQHPREYKSSKLTVHLSLLTARFLMFEFLMTKQIVKNLL